MDGLIYTLWYIRFNAATLCGQLFISRIINMPANTVVQNITKNNHVFIQYYIRYYKARISLLLKTFTYGFALLVKHTKMFPTKQYC